MIAYVKNDYNEVILSCFDIGKDGGYKAVIPLPKCQNRDMYAIYHQEKLEWNTLEFIGSNDSDVLDNNDKKVKGLSINGKSKLVIGVCYDPVV
ncbi:hypothetical protein [Pectinatus sottacetonis]|uniref:hypothetical protein n=1 Tax=Pectinatus sottacetonis TaxID=1002795 RepID=UPI0018C6FE97|nr:hypothetical protein [Pectinatus sottacetonis]